MGHVNNAVYLTYLEIGRQAYWDRFDDDVDYAKVPFVLANVAIDFRNQARVGDVVRVQLKATWAGRSSFGMKYLLTERDSGRVLAEAETAQVTYDYDVEEIQAEEEEGDSLAPPRRFLGILNWDSS